MNLNINNKIKEFLIITIAAILTFFSFIIEGFLFFGRCISKAIIKTYNKLLTNNK